jgi:hypothetical protein
MNYNEHLQRQRNRELGIKIAFSVMVAALFLLCAVLVKVNA